MISTIQKKSVAILICVFFINTYGLAQNRGIEKVYNIPLKEMEDAVSNLLRHSGFDIYRTTPNMGEVKLYAENQKESWQIILKHHSPLSTRVVALYFLDNQTVIEKVENLWQYLSEYVREASFDKSYLEQSIPSAVAAQMKSVVCIRAKAGNQVIKLSGFIVDEKGLIICTAHNLKNSKEISITLYDGRKIKGKKVKMDIRHDLTLIDVGQKLNNPIRMDKKRNLLEMGERLFSVNCPKNLVGMVHSGIIDSPPRRVKDFVLWQVNMTILPGSSGSPVFDVNGNLVAIVKGRYRGTESVGFLIPLDYLVAFLKEK